MQLHFLLNYDSNSNHKEKYEKKMSIKKFLCLYYKTQKPRQATG